MAVRAIGLKIQIFKATTGREIHATFAGCLPVARKKRQLSRHPGARFESSQPHQAVLH